MLITYTHTLPLHIIISHYLTPTHSKSHKTSHQHTLIQAYIHIYIYINIYIYRPSCIRTEVAAIMLVCAAMSIRQGLLRAAATPFRVPIVQVLVYTYLIYIIKV